MRTGAFPILIPKPTDYRNLPHGTFTLKVKAIGAAQVWSEPFEYTFTIRPPWWFTWWAYTLYGILITGLLYALYRFLLNQQLQLAETHRLRELDEVKTKLYTNITHEFRTPLTVIQGVTTRIRNEGEKLDSKKIIDDTHIVNRNSAQLLTLVNQMLDLRKLESGQLPVRMVQGDVVIYLRYLLESFHSLAEAKDIGLHFLNDERELIMDYDPEKLRHIVSNLLSNAVKFTPEGGEVYLSVEKASAKRTPSALRTEDALLIEVRDTGVGIPPEKIPHIFDRFYQIDDESTRKAEGTGIGLTLTKELVHLLEGEIDVKSEVGRGTTFSVWLPIRRTAPMVEGVPEVMQPVETAAAGVEQPSAVFEKPVAAGLDELPLVLIIEDNKDVAHYIRSCLEAGYRLETAYNGKEGIDKAIELVPDLIISDVMMPEKDGFEVCDTLKHDERTSHIPVVLLTAKADMESRIAGLRRGADAYLAKPFNREELKVRLEQLIELRRALQKRYAGLQPLELSDEEHQLEDEFLLKVRGIIEEHLSDASFDLPRLCRAVGMSRSQIFRKLKALTGQSTTQVIRSYRLHRARDMLKKSDLNVSEVAYEVGFTNPAYFTRTFKEEFGVAPSEVKNG
jgi:signal transduction histidine kinase/DNA-binding response OmpR family regulator